MKTPRTPAPSQNASNFPAYDSTTVAQTLNRWQGVPGNLLPILHDIQDQLGFVPAGAVAQIARALNLSRAEVHGVITFYHDFRQTPGGTSTLKICQAESCQAVGSRELTAHAERVLGCRLGETTADQRVSLEAVYCLGNCANSPAFLLDERLYGRATAQKLEHAIASTKEKSA